MLFASPSRSSSTCPRRYRKRAALLHSVPAALIGHIKERRFQLRGVCANGAQI